MEEEKMEKVVTAYLKRKGFKAAELALQQDLQDSNSNNDSSSCSSSLTAYSYTDNHLVLSSTQVENGPARYYDGYSKLRSWTYNSLDLYKHELLPVLYPVFIHCFMDLVAQEHIQEARNLFYTFRDDHEMIHVHDIQKLEGVLSPSHLEETEFAHMLRQSKTNIQICQYSYDLLLQYLHKTQSTTMLGIINEHITFEVSPGHPSSISDDTDGITIVGGYQDAANQINQREIRWGLLEDCLEKTGALLSDTDKTDVETIDGDVEDNKKRPAELRKKDASVEKLKKDKATILTGKPAHSESNSVFTAKRVEPKLALPVMSTEVELSILEDLRNRVQLNSVSLPSISFYTFINTHNGLNCSAISRDGSLVAGGFSDSSLKVWDMAKLGQQMNESSVQAGNEIPTSEQLRESDGGKQSYTLFQGHSGPVYSATFSPLGDFILSSSADSTIRLWSTKLDANVVCYKGHNYPVWDVQFNPRGHYFVSCSHDRTARLWSMDRLQPIRIMAGHLSDVDCVQWHANCNYIATGSSDKTVRLWDVQTGECARIFIGHKSMILSLACSPDGRYMASGDEDGTIMMWDVASGCCITPLGGHASCVWSLAYSCEGSLLASGSADSTVKLWDVNSTIKLLRSDEINSGSPNRIRCLKTLPTKSTPVYSLQFSRRNLLFAAGALSKDT